MPEGKKPRSIVETFGTTSDGSAEVFELFEHHVFPNPKPSGLIKHFIDILTGDNDTILDFFAGSATLAHAVMRLNAEDGGNRRYIQVQLPEPVDVSDEAYKLGYKVISDIAKERIRRAGKIVASQLRSVDVGFKVFKLADSNFTKWQAESNIDTDSLQKRLFDMRESSDDNATEEDLLTEILLKLGMSLTVQVSKKDIADLSLWEIGDGAILAYLDEHIKPSLDQLRAIAGIFPVKLVLLEDVFQGDDELKTNLTQICKTNKVELWTI